MFVSNNGSKLEMFRPVLLIVCVLTTIKSLDAGQVTVGEFTMSGDKGDYITGGKNYTYSASAGDKISVSADDSHCVVHIRIDGYHGDNWSLDLSAPQGEKLVIGEYLNATRHPFNKAGPGISVGGNGRGCNTILGSFVINYVSYGPNATVDRFEATFEQHCEGGQSSLRGSVSIGFTSCAWTLCGEACDAQEGGHLYMCDFRSCGLKKQFYCCLSKHCSN